MRDGFSYQQNYLKIQITGMSQWYGEYIVLLNWVGYIDSHSIDYYEDLYCSCGDGRGHNC